MAYTCSPPTTLAVGAALALCLFVAPRAAHASPAFTPALTAPNADTAGVEALAWPPDAWKIRRTSRRARRKAYSVTRRSAGKTMAARRARTAKRRRNTLQGVKNSRALKSKARKTRRRRNSRRPH